MTVRVQLLLRWNTYLLFNPDIVNFVWKTDEGKTESIVFLIFILWWCFNCRWMRGGRMGHKVLLRANWNRIFFQQGGEFGRSNRYDTFWHVAATVCFYVSDFRLLKIYKKLGRKNRKQYFFFCWASKNYWISVIIWMSAGAFI